MTTPDQPVAIDQANNLLAETPAILVTALLDTPAGQRMALTIRTPSTTLTVLLSAADAKSWAASMNQAASQMSQSGLYIANGGPIG